MKEWLLENLKLMKKIKRGESKLDSTYRFLGFEIDEDGYVVRIGRIGRICMKIKNGKINSFLIGKYIGFKTVLVIMISAGYILVKKDIEIFEAIAKLY